jgi:hypothetical protein
MYRETLDLFGNPVLIHIVYAYTKETVSQLPVFIDSDVIKKQLNNELKRKCILMIKMYTTMNL